MKTTTDKFDGSQTGTYSKYAPQHYFGFWLFIIVLVILVAFVFAVFAPVITAHAESSIDTRSNACHTYNVNSIFGKVDNIDGVACGNSSDSADRADNADGDKKVNVTTVTESPREIVTDTTDATEDSNVPTVETKVHCNNGEGNGREGCSPAKSPNANNDENDSTPKEDKSHNAVSVVVLIATIKRGRKSYTFECRSVDDYHKGHVGIYWNNDMVILRGKLTGAFFAESQMTDGGFYTEQLRALEDKDSYLQSWKDDKNL